MVVVVYRDSLHNMYLGIGYPIGSNSSVSGQAAPGKHHGIHSGRNLLAAPDQPTSPISWLLSGNLNKTLSISGFCKRVNFLGLPTFKTRSRFFSQSVDAPAFKQKFDLSLIPVVAEDEIHNLRCSELICSQTLTLNYMTNISIIPWCINHVQVWINKECGRSTALFPSETLVSINLKFWNFCLTFEIVCSCILSDFLPRVLWLVKLGLFFRTDLAPCSPCPSNLDKRTSRLTN